MPSVRRLKTAGDVRCALAKLYRDMEEDRVDVNKGRALVYLLSTLGNVIQASDFEARLDALERKREEEP